MITEKTLEQVATAREAYKKHKPVNCENRQSAQKEALKHVENLIQEGFEVTIVKYQFNFYVTASVHEYDRRFYYPLIPED